MQPANMYNMDEKGFLIEILHIDKRELVQQDHDI